MGLGSEIRDLEKTYSGSRIQSSKRHRIPDPGSGSATQLQRWQIIFWKPKYQCCWSALFWCRSGSGSEFLIRCWSRSGPRSASKQCRCTCGSDPKFSQVGKSEIYLPYQGKRGCSLYSEWPLICALWRLGGAWGWGNKARLASKQPQSRQIHVWSQQLLLVLQQQNSNYHSHVAVTTASPY